VTRIACWHDAALEGYDWAEIGSNIVCCTDGLNGDVALGMQMACRSGDMRRLLDVCAAAVDLIVLEASELQHEQAKGVRSNICNHSHSLFIVVARTYI
jgi:hypothetical protein